MPARRLAVRLGALGTGLLLVPVAPGLAQDERRGGSPIDLPRPGYEPVVHRVGAAAITLAVDASALYDSNVYATSRAARDDVVAVVRPAATIALEEAGWALHAAGYAELWRHVDVTREDATLFGAAIDGSARVSPAASLDAALRYDRAVQSRADPEARAPITLPPRKIDVFAADFGASYRTGAVDIRIAPGFDRLRFLDPAERDRDLRTWRVTTRITWRPAAPVAFFVEGYANRRDFDLARDFAGVNRDATTYGLLVGASRDVSARLRGSLGVGVFRFDSADPIVPGHTGIAASGRVTWSPRARTAVTFEAFRGDVATVRVGAAGRTDTDLSLRLDQEARHDLILSAGVGYHRSVFRGSGRQQTRWVGRIGADYLLDRRFTLFVSGERARRDATLPTDEFSRAVIRAGLRSRF